MVHAGRFQSTPPARGATGALMERERVYFISIHAPREGGDGNAVQAAAASTEFQSTPPARGATVSNTYSIGTPSPSKFQSTPPARGATVSSIPTPPTT